MAALLLQLVVIYITAMMGLGWGGSTYTAATMQSLLALAVIVVVAVFVRRPPMVLTVPLVSAGLTAVLLMIGS